MFLFPVFLFCVLFTDNMFFLVKEENNMVTLLLSYLQFIKGLEKESA